MDLVLIITIGAIVGIGILAWAATEVAQILNRGRTTREIFAYVAEGAISPEDAAALVELSERADLRRKILRTANHDHDWDRWRQTVREVFNDDFGADRRRTPKDGPA
ncbi:MAG: hypothetical protein KDA28_08420 [Phycisphaerales bacterium]|nr:hypothetical protein [Phycisphaerales bacterium]